MRAVATPACVAWLMVAVVLHAATAHAQDAEKRASDTKASSNAEQHKTAAQRKADAKRKADAQRELDAQRLTDNTAYTLDGGSLRLGLFRIEYGIFDFLSVGTYTLPWGLLAPTVLGKLRLWHAEPITLAVQTGFAYFDSSRLALFDRSPGDAVVTVFPLEALASFRFGPGFTLSGSAAYTEVAVDGVLTADVFDGAASGVADNFQITLTAEFRMSRAVALIVHGRWLMLQRVAGNAAATLHPDDFTTVVVNSSLESSSFRVRDMFSIVPSLLFTVGVFNLRLGVGYGNYNVPLVNFVLPQRMLIPEFDLYFVL
jgi:hypothetical protein